MKAENFCFWLQGFFELTPSKEITPEQAEQIKVHLALVFKHDPTMAHEKPSGVDRLVEIQRDRNRMSDTTLYC